MIEREALWVLGASGSRASAVPEPLVPPRGSAPGGVIPAATSKIVTQLRDALCGLPAWPVHLFGTPVRQWISSLATSLREVVLVAALDMLARIAR